MVIKYLSYSSWSCYENNPEEFYWRYFSDAPRTPQLEPMAVGSAFDSCVKRDLVKILFGRDEDLFETAVEKQHWDTARPIGEEILRKYKECGAFNDMLEEMQGAASEPVFEFDIINEVGGVPLRCKPDVFFINKHGARVVYDWKVNGYLAAKPPSPGKGYIKLRPGNKSHKDAIPMMHKGLMINAQYMDNDWAKQLSMYAWVTGEPVGSEDWIIGIDQLIGRDIRVASFRSRVASKFQYDQYEKIKLAWDRIQQGWVFHNLTKEENDEKIATKKGDWLFK